MAIFVDCIGIDYSGAKTPTESLRGLRVYQAEGGAQPIEVLPPPSSKRYWTRRGLSEWLVDRLKSSRPTLVGIDHGFSFPQQYFNLHGVPHNWQEFLDDFQHHWPTDQSDVYVDFIRDGIIGKGTARQGNTRWRRLTELRAGGAKSVFHFGVPGAVATSTHAGIPWLRFIRQQLGERVHFWPFDGWDIPAGRSAIVEVYPALWSHQFPNVGRTSDQHDAFSIAAWLSRADRDGSLKQYLKPALSQSELAVAQIEGWILGVSSTPPPKRSLQTGSQAKDKHAERPPLSVSDGGAKVCPECGYQFKGRTWSGVDAHWKAFHGDVMSYDEAWPVIRVGGVPSKLDR